MPNPQSGGSPFVGCLKLLIQYIPSFPPYLEGVSHWEDQGIGGWTLLKWILKRQDGMVWIGLIWLRIGASGGLL
jgi:hypothetical protein